MLLMSGMTGIPGMEGRWKKRQRPYQPPHVVGAKAFAANRISVRRRLHKAFFAWFAVNRHRFAIDLKIEKRVDEWVEVSFVGINPAITAHLSAQVHEMEILVEFPNEDANILLDFWALPMSVPGGYIDRSLLPEYRELLPSRERIWELGIFEPFIEWINGTLAKAYWVELRGKRDYWSDVRLLMTADPGAPEAGNGKTADEYRFVMPCRTDTSPRVAHADHEQ